jgi:hypothetical protein
MPRSMREGLTELSSMSKLIAEMMSLCRVVLYPRYSGGVISFSILWPLSVGGSFHFDTPILILTRYYLFLIIPYPRRVRRTKIHPFLSPRLCKGQTFRRGTPPAAPPVSASLTAGHAIDNLVFYDYTSIEFSDRERKQL